MGKAVVLLSGGIDSAVTAYKARTEPVELCAMTLRYGQSLKKEVDCATKLAGKLGITRHLILDLPLNEIGGSSLFKKEDIPTSRSSSMAQNYEKVYGPLRQEGIPSTWVPQRNSIFLTLAFGWAEVVGADKVYIGAHAVDYSGYPDCRPEFFEAMADALNLASKRFVETGYRIQIVTPIVGYGKKNIVELGLKLGVPFQDTWSCYKGDDLACGICDSCRIRLKAFADLGIVDQIKYNLDNICEECLKGSCMPDCPLPIGEQAECIRGKGLDPRLTHFTEGVAGRR